MIAGVYNIHIDQGASFERLITVKDSSDVLFDFTDYTAQMQIRRDIEDSTPIVTMTTENGYITLGGTAGTITLYLPPVITKDIVDRECVYDLEITDSNSRVYRLLKGRVKVDGEVTR